MIELEGEHRRRAVMHGHLRLLDEHERIARVIDRQGRELRAGCLAVDVHGGVHETFLTADSRVSHHGRLESGSRRIRP